MLNSKRMLVLINLLGGTAVIASYVWGLSYRTDASAVLWGGVPGQFRQLITMNMILAAAGYLGFTSFLLWLPREYLMNPDTGMAVINRLYAAILVCSALWMSLTWLAINQVSALLAWFVRLDLAAVALASLALLSVIIKNHTVSKRWWHWLAVIGAVFFNIQTVLLDAVLWSVYFRV
ncbi:MAG: hypothetical protein ACYC6L_04100 [Anaerolineae bacterium]